MRSDRPLIAFNGPVVSFRQENTGKRWYEIKNAATDSADIYFYDVIGETWDGGISAKQFAADLKALGAVKTLNLYLNSPGGSVFDGVAIFNQLDRHKARKVVYVDGYAASIASVIAMVGDEINIADNALMMIHDPWGFVIGGSADMRRQADLLDTIKGTIANTYAARTGQSLDKINEWMTAETWMTAAECVDRGFADNVMKSNAAAAALEKHDIKAFGFRSPPDVASPPADVTPPAPRRPHNKVAEIGARVARMKAAAAR